MYRSNRSSASKIMDFSLTENCTLTSKNTFCLCHLFPHWKLSKPRTNQKQCRIAGFNPNSQISLSTGIIILKRVDNKMDLTPARYVFWVRKLRTQRELHCGRGLPEVPADASRRRGGAGQSHDVLLANLTTCCFKRSNFGCTLW